MENEDDEHRRIFKRRKPPSQHKKRGPKPSPVPAKRACRECALTKPMSEFCPRVSGRICTKLSDYNTICKSCDSRHVVKVSRMKRLKTLTDAELDEELLKAIVEADHIREEKMRRREQR